MPEPISQGGTNVPYIPPSGPSSQSVPQFSSFMDPNQFSSIIQEIQADVNAITSGNGTPQLENSLLQLLNQLAQSPLSNDQQGTREMISMQAMSQLQQAGMVPNAQSSQAIQQIYHFFNFWVSGH